MSNVQIFFVNLVHTYDEYMLKISKQYFDLQKSYDQSTKNSEKQVAYLQQDTVNFAEGRPFVSLNFQLIGHKFYVNQDIALKFSAFVHHISVLH